METNSQICKTRITWMDLAKGFAILTVVFLHTYNGYPTEGTVAGYVNRWITSFHMAFFFACSGYFFYLPNTVGDIKIKAVKRIKSLLVPYVVWGILIGFFVDNVRDLIRTGGSIDYLDTFLKVITGRQFFMVVPWFLFVLIGVYCVEYLVTFLIKDCSKKNVIWMIFNCLCLPLGYFIGYFPVGEYFRSSLILISCFFFAFGMILKKIIDRSLQIRPVHQLLIGGGLLALGGIICFVNGRVSYAGGRFGDPVLHTVCALSTIIGLSLLFVYLDQKKWFHIPNKCLSYFGNHSIIVLLTHPILLYGIRMLEKLFHMEIHTFPAIPSFLIVLVTQYLVIKLMPKKMLWTFGK